MKKNEKGFMQDEKNLEKVAGGAVASGLDLEQNIKVKLGDVDSTIDLIKNQKVTSTQDINGHYNAIYSTGTTSING